MRVKCANCGMIYDTNPTDMDFRTERERLSTAQCPGCKSNAKNIINRNEWTTQQYDYKSN